jgi:hypothetical protein
LEYETNDYPDGCSYVVTLDREYFAQFFPGYFLVEAPKEVSEEATILKDQRISVDNLDLSAECDPMVDYEENDSISREGFGVVGGFLDVKTYYDLLDLNDEDIKNLIRDNTNKQGEILPPLVVVTLNDGSFMFLIPELADMPKRYITFGIGNRYIDDENLADEILKKIYDLGDFRFQPVEEVFPEIVLSTGDTSLYFLDEQDL